MLTDLKVAAETLQPRPAGQVARLTFLHAPGEVLGKRYHMSCDKVVKNGAPKVPTFEYLPREVSTPDEFFAVLSKAEKHPDICRIRARPGKWFPRDGKPVYRLLHAQEGVVNNLGRRISQKVVRERGLVPNVCWLPAFEDHPTPWAMVDVDGIESPEGAAWVTDPKGVAEYVRDNFLPPCLQGVTCRFQITGSARDPTNPDSWYLIKMRLAFWLDRGLLQHELEGLFDGCPVDPATFRTVQPIYTANPIYWGLPDPVARRSGVVEGEFDVVELPSVIPAAKRRARPDSEGTVRVVVKGAPDGTGLVDPLPEVFIEALSRVGDGAGECRSRLGNAAAIYARVVGIADTDIKALAALLAEEGRKHRLPGEVAS